MRHSILRASTADVPGISFILIVVDPQPLHHVVLTYAKANLSELIIRTSQSNLIISFPIEDIVNFTVYSI